MVAVSNKPTFLSRYNRWWFFRKVLLVWIFVCSGLYLLEGGGTTFDFETEPLQLDNKNAEQRRHHEECPIRRIADLSEEELEPKAGSRHMVDPPSGGKLSLICCGTTKGTFSTLLHHDWAPIGVARLLDMVHEGYFSTKIPLFRCTDACQFGLSADPEWTKRYNAGLRDDPMWLPPGKDHRSTDKGVKRYPEGMWTYAGAGPDSRSNQFVITLKPNPFMGGGSPWEVPLGEFVGKESFELLPKLYNGYGEKGPSQAVLRREGASEHVQKEWPLMDYIVNCSLVDELNQ